jgi:hypothetical protein
VLERAVQNGEVFARKEGKGRKGEREKVKKRRETVPYPPTMI